MHVNLRLAEIAQPFCLYTFLLNDTWNIRSFLSLETLLDTSSSEHEMTKGTEHPLNTWYWCAQSGNACGLYTYVVGNPGDPDISGNVNVTADDWCFGQIKGDPDIAGWGVSIDST